MFFVAHVMKLFGLALDLFMLVSNLGGHSLLMATVYIIMSGHLHVSWLILPLYLLYDPLFVGSASIPLLLSSPCIDRRWLDASGKTVRDGR